MLQVVFSWVLKQDILLNVAYRTRYLCNSIQSIHHSNRPTPATRDTLTSPCWALDDLFDVVLCSSLSTCYSNSSQHNIFETLGYRNTFVTVLGFIKKILVNMFHISNLSIFLMNLNIIKIVFLYQTSYVDLYYSYHFKCDIYCN